MLQSIRELPTPKPAKNEKKWSFFYAPDLRVLRDLFLYCIRKGQKGAALPELVSLITSRNREMQVMTRKKGKMVNAGFTSTIKGMTRDYLHAARYLGLLERRNSKWHPNQDKHSDAKQLFILESEKSPHSTTIDSQLTRELTDNEKLAFQEILWDYHHVRTFAWWFTDFTALMNPSTLTLLAFREQGKGVGVISRKNEIFWWKEIDKTTWKVPRRYHRLSVITHLYPQWLQQVELIDRCPIPGNYILKRHGHFKQWWIGFYPLDGRRKSVKELIDELDNHLQANYAGFRGGRNVAVWIPELLWDLANRFRQPLDVIKRSLQLLVKENPQRYYLERTSSDVISKQTRYHEESYLKVDGMYRSALLITLT